MVLIHQSIDVQLKKLQHQVIVLFGKQRSGVLSCLILLLPKVKDDF
jgi:hypothetical protein